MQLTSRLTCNLVANVNDCKNNCRSLQMFLQDVRSALHLVSGAEGVSSGVQILTDQITCSRQPGSSCTGSS